MRIFFTIGSILLYLFVFNLTPVIAEDDNSTLSTAKTKGERLYMRFCSVCHGTDGKGEDTGLHHLKTLPPDLTQISARNGGEFPWVKTFNTIYGVDSTVSHNARQMPEWGDLFDLRNWSEIDNEYAAEIVHGRILQLLLYLDAIQAPVMPEKN